MIWCQWRIISTKANVFKQIANWRFNFLHVNTLTRWGIKCTLQNFVLVYTRWFYLADWGTTFLLSSRSSYRHRRNHRYRYYCCYQRCSCLSWSGAIVIQHVKTWFSNLKTGQLEGHRKLIRLDKPWRALENANNILYHHSHERKCPEKYVQYVQNIIANTTQNKCNEEKF